MGDQKGPLVSYMGEVGQNNSAELYFLRPSATACSILSRTTRGDSKLRLLPTRWSTRQSCPRNNAIPPGGRCFLLRLPWPSGSPDANPIEKLWNLMKHRMSVHSRRPVKKDTLITAIREEWNRFTALEIRELTASLHAQVQAIHDAEGGHTHAVLGSSWC
jgi:hypothetical protein